MIKKGNILARTLHKWIGLIMGLQISIWLLTGLYMVKQRVVTLIDHISSQPREIYLRKGSKVFMTREQKLIHGT